MLTLELVFPLLNCALISLDLSPPLIVNGRDLALILRHKLLLRVMGLIPEFVDNRLNFSVPLLNHFFSHPLLKLLLLVLSLALVSLHPLLPGNLLLLADPLDLVTLLPLHFRNFFVKLYALLFNLRLSLDNSLLELLLKTVFLSFPLRFKPVVLPVHITLPTEALLVELGL